MKKIKINFKKAKNSFNFRLKEEELTNLFGLKKLQVLNSNYIPFGEYSRFRELIQLWNFVRVYMYSYHNSEGAAEPKLIFLDSQKLLRYAHLKTPTGLLETFSSTLVSNELPTEVMNMKVGNEDVLFMCFENAHMHRFSLNAGTKLAAYEGVFIRSMCFGFNKLFVLSNKNPYSVEWSENLNPAEWLIGSKGKINFSEELGKTKKVFEFKGQVYIAAEYGFIKVASNSEQNRFSSKICFKTGSRIFENSISICEDNIMFLTEEGLYKFSGTSLKKIPAGFEGLVDGEFAGEFYGAYFNNNYYISARLKYKDGIVVSNENYDTTINNTLIKINLNDNSTELFRGHSSYFLSALNSEGYSKLITIGLTDFTIYEIDEEECRIGTSDLLKVFESEEFDLGEPDKYKILKEICIQSDSDCILKIYADDKLALTLPHYGSTKIGCHKILVKAKTFRIRIDNITSKVTVRKLELKFC